MTEPACTLIKALDDFVKVRITIARHDHELREHYISHKAKDNYTAEDALKETESALCKALEKAGLK